MAFEPLQTDERVEGPAKRQRDFDAQMLFGCTAFVITSLITYLLAVWPWFAFPATHTVPVLGLAVACGFVPSAAFGIAGMRRAGLAGGCGYLGGIMATAIFVHLRMDQHGLGRFARHLPLPEYPDNWKFLLPSAYVLVAGILLVAFLPRGEIQDEPAAGSSRES